MKSVGAKRERVIHRKQWLRHPGMMALYTLQKANLQEFNEIYNNFMLIHPQLATFGDGMHSVKLNDYWGKEAVERYENRDPQP